MLRNCPLVLLDVEQTLTEDWISRSAAPALLMDNIELVRAELGTNADLEMGLMSWAIQDEGDMDAFQRLLRPALEEVLRHSFTDRWCLSMDQWANELLVSSGKLLSREDIFDIFGKPELLFKLATIHPELQGRDVTLLDDSFQNMVLSLPERGTTVRVIRI